MTRGNVIDHALEIAGRGLVLVATSNNKGVPHVAAANSIRKQEPGRLVITDWFCPETAANAEIGSPVSIVIWDPANDEGYQIIGYVSAVEELAIMSGYLPGEENAGLPQEERRLVVDVGKVMAFCQAVHSDHEEEAVRRRTRQLSKAGLKK